MNGTIALIFLGIAVTGGLVLLVRWAAREISELAIGIVLALLAVTAIGWAAVQLLTGVFSWHGLAYSVGLAPAGDLTWPVAVRVTTLALITELIVLTAWAADYHADRGPHRPAHAWLWAHITAPSRMVWHGALAPAMVLRDLAYRRRYAWPVRPRHRFELAAILGALAGDVLRPIAALPTTARRLAWRNLITVTRTHRVPVVPDVTVVDGEAIPGEILQTWRACDNLPAPREADQEVTA